MQIVLDTNILLVAISKKSLYNSIWQAFINGKYKLIISEEIIHEYEEILIKYAAPRAAYLVNEIFAESPDIIYKRIYYNWNIITIDPDDNKFFDAAVAGNADYLVTNDKHFNEALKIEFPKVNIINAEMFMELI